METALHENSFAEFLCNGKKRNGVSLEKDVGLREVFKMGIHSDPLASSGDHYLRGKCPRHWKGKEDRVQPLRTLLSLWDRWNSNKVFKMFAKTGRIDQ